MNTEQTIRLTSGECRALLQRPPLAPQHVRDRMRREFMKAYGLQQHDGGHFCVHLLAGKPCDDLYCLSWFGIPCFEHAEKFRLREEYVLTMQPYEVDARALDAWCTRWGLTWREIPGASWHYPGWTTMVVISKA